MPFLILITLGTLLIASAAIFFSVLGLVQTFSETALYWGTAIEVAKLVIASFVYRYWDQITTLKKVLGVTFIGLVMVITSLGISGHIIASMQQEGLALTSQQIQIQTIDDRITRTKERISFVEERIEERRNRLQAIEDEIGALPDNFVTARRQLIQERQPEKDDIQGDLETLFDERDALFLAIEDDELSRAELSLESEQIQIKIGPINELVEIFGADAQKTIYIFILIIIISFDPLAVYLTIAANQVAIDLRIKKEKKKKESSEAGVSKAIESSDNDEKLNDIVQTMDYIKGTLEKNSAKKQQIRDSLS